MSKDTTLLNQDVKQQEILEKKMRYLLDNAIMHIMLETRFNSPINFTDVNNSAKEFNLELNVIEEQLLASFMFEEYVNENTITLINKLRHNLHYTDDEIKVFCPANSLSAFEESYARLKKDNENLILRYKTRYRDNLKHINYPFANQDCLPNKYKGGGDK